MTGSLLSSDDNRSLTTSLDGKLAPGALLMEEEDVFQNKISPSTYPTAAMDPSQDAQHRALISFSPRSHPDVSSERLSSLRAELANPSFKWRSLPPPVKRI